MSRDVVVQLERVPVELISADGAARGDRGMVAGVVPLPGLVEARLEECPTLRPPLRRVLLLSQHLLQVKVLRVLCGLRSGITDVALDKG